MLAEHRIPVRISPSLSCIFSLTADGLTVLTCRVSPVQCGKSGRLGTKVYAQPGYSTLVEQVWKHDVAPKCSNYHHGDELHFLLCFCLPSLFGHCKSAFCRPIVFFGSTMWLNHKVVNVCFHPPPPPPLSLSPFYFTGRNDPNANGLHSYATKVRNRRLFQRLSGFETGYPAAAGPLPAFDFSVSDEQGAAFLVSVMNCSDCDASGLDYPNSSSSIACLKEYLRRKRGQLNGKKAEALELDYLYWHSQSPRIHTACWPPDLESCPNFTSLALQPLAELSIVRGLIIWPAGVNGTLSLRACLSLLRSPLSFHADRRTEKSRWKKKNTDGTASACSREATGLPRFAMIGNVRVKRLLGMGREVKIFRGEVLTT